MEAIRLEKFDRANHGSLVEELTQLLHAAYAPLTERGLRYWASHQAPDDTLKRLMDGESYLAFCG